jgi:hypothetical protein
MSQNFKPVSVRAFTCDAPVSMGPIRTTDSLTTDTILAAGKILTAEGPEGKVNMGKIWDGVLAGLENMTPTERGPLLEKLNKRIACGWGKENAVGMRSTTNDGRVTNDSAERQNETNRKFWQERGVGVV